MNGSKRVWQAVMVLGGLLALWALSVIGTAYAQGGAPIEGAPVIVVQGSETADPAPAVPQTAEGPAPAVVDPTQFYIYLSAPGNGTVKGVAYGDEDVLRYDPSGAGLWVKVFDGSNAGLPGAADIDALAVQRLDLGMRTYMSFEKPVTVPGLGLVDDSDIVTYSTQLLSNGVWAMFFDGSAHGLTTDGEDIDAFELVATTEFNISTFGGATVPGYYEPTLTVADEDVLRVQQGGAVYLKWFDGGLRFGLADANDVRGLAYYYSGSGELNFLSVQRAATFGSGVYAVSAAPNDIVVREDAIAMTRYTLVFDASASGFPKVDAFDVERK